MSVDLRVAVTERSIERVASLHSLPIETFEGMKIYDLGCGKSDIGADLALRGIKSTVIGFDENLEALNTTQGHEQSTEKQFARLDRLPVDDESADIALATYSLPLYGKRPDQIRRFFNEAKRVVRVGGLLSVYPTVVGLAGSYQGVRGSFDRDEALEIELTKIRRAAEWLSLSQDRETITARKLS